MTNATYGRASGASSRPELSSREFLGIPAVFDKDVYNGDLGVVSRIDMEEGELSVDFDGRESTMALASSMSWYWHTQRQSTRARARNTPPS